MAIALTPEDQLALKNTQDMRERLARVIMGKEDSALPTKPAELMAVTNLLESIDRSVLGRAKIRIEEEAGNGAAADKELLRELLITLHSDKKYSHTETPTAPVEAPAYMPSDRAVSPGELIIRQDTPEIPENFQ